MPRDSRQVDPGEPDEAPSPGSAEGAGDSAQNAIDAARPESGRRDEGGKGERSEDSPSVWNVSNLLSGFRLAGSPWLLLLAWADWRTAFLVWLVVLMLSDWLDGKLAIAWNLRTEWGARLDSLADATMYGALWLGGWILLPDFVARETGWILAALGSFALTVLVGLVRFRRVPSYHTFGAKLSWMLTSVGALIVLFQGPAWPFRVAMAAVTLTNLEATAISLVLPRWQADVRSLYHAWRRK